MTTLSLGSSVKYSSNSGVLCKYTKTFEIHFVWDHKNLLNKHLYKEFCYNNACLNSH